MQPQVSVNWWDDWFVKFTIIACVLGLGVFIAWAGFVPLSQGIITQGKIDVYSQKKTVQHLEGGIIQHIHIREGQTVQKGDVLIVMQDIQAMSMLETFKNEYYHLVALLNRLTAEAHQKDQITFDEILINQPKLETIITNQQSLFRANQLKQQNELMILDEQQKQLNNELQGHIAQKESLIAQRNSLQSELDRLHRLVQKQLVTVQEVTDIERQLITTKGDIGGVQASIKVVKNKISENQQEIKKHNNVLKEKALDKLPEVEADIKTNLEKMKSMEDVVNRSYVVAPQSGKVINLQFHTVGGVIQAGTKILDIVPENDKYIVKSKVPLIDIDNIYIGKQTQIKFIGLNQRTLPNIYGKVLTISADSILDEYNGAIYYEVIVDVLAEELEKLGQVNILSGMPIETIFEGEKRTVLEYISDPIIDIIEKSLIEE